MQKINKKISVIILLLMVLLLFFINKGDKEIILEPKIDTPLIDVDFDESNGIKLLEKYDIPFTQPSNIVNLKLGLLRKNYEQLKPSKMIFEESPIIPKIIHIVWIGSDPLPKNYQYYIETWRRFHPHWQIKVWNEEDFKNENFANYDLYQLAESYAERVDIMRYEILYKYGGLYVDTDIECFANFDELHHKYDFYINLEPPIINKGTIQVVNSMIGSYPSNPIFIKALEKIKNEWYNNTALFFNNFASYPIKSARSKHHLAVRRTMIPFSDLVFELLMEQDLSKSKSVVLPIGYNVPFYPISDNYSYKKIMRPETRSIHHYDKDNSFVDNPGFNQSLFDFNIILNDNVEVMRSQKYLYLNLQDLFKENFPNKLSFEPFSQLPENIYLYNSDKLNIEALEDLKTKWLKYNPFARIYIIDDMELLDYISQKTKLQDDDILKVIARFYLLNNNGGIFVETNFKPANLQEFNYKYKFYGQLNTVLNPDDLLDIAINFIASKKNHVIIDRVIQDIEDEIQKNHRLTLAKIKKIYLHNIYKYNSLEGKNIVFPENIFEQKR